MESDESPTALNVVPSAWVILPARSDRHVRYNRTSPRLRVISTPHPARMIPTFRTVYQDERLLVLDKPSGLLAVPGRGPELQDCLSARVQAVWPTAVVVHRLDRDTSGVIVMALDSDAQRELGRQFAERETVKIYVAVVAGRIGPDEGMVDLPLRKDFDRPPRHCVDPVYGRPSQTHWRTVERFDDRTRVELEPLTGRSHQLRIHMAELGHAILGDPLYGDERTLRMAERLLLHAERLTLTHPTDGRRVTFESSVPF
jgi:tRNA pseudouridine32 synthase / 23S rRNA pseudouridine746 synthase